MISPVFWCRQYGRPCDLDWYSTHGVPTPRAAAGAITLGASGLNASERALPPGLAYRANLSAVGVVAFSAR